MYLLFLHEDGLKMKALATSRTTAPVRVPNKKDNECNVNTPFNSIAYSLLLLLYDY